MEMLKNRIDFKVLLLVNNANANGDPINGNRPRITPEGYGIMTDVCIKRKIRNRLMDMGQPVFVQPDTKCIDGFKSLKERANSIKSLKVAEQVNDNEKYAEIACSQWIDVRSFGQLFPFKGSNSISIRGPVSVQTAFTVSPVDTMEDIIVKSTSGKASETKGHDTIGRKAYIRHGLFIFAGSIFPQLASLTGFSEADADLIHRSLLSLFQGDSSVARPAGSMEVYQVFWWRHNNSIGQYPPAKVHRTVAVVPMTEFPQNITDYKITVENLPNLIPEIGKETMI
ncbi:type I-C CRISPR-associated protein Cas7/Csd2 [Clostridium sp. KNHs216]|uniref:type I-C CRISPR-associated protein Cas7/Csd2 n=1 Tax=Clostridium sp. KNHs216 TaxID=1550235 RepID=UPI001150A482|nr:type I-C CRISPR-associated protein Cas7/Csd2 [Clostridium sp. KNHs216]TQI68575.1 CRISPR-associated protein Csd2 [Clostridium sp. KNHs216]